VRRFGCRTAGRTIISGRLVLIATHHKTGTVWMRQLFQSIARRLDCPFLRVADYQPVDSEALRARAPLAILFQDHGRFAADMGLTPDDRGWHLVRDPRDVLISGANYHGWSDEPWLHEARDSLGGRTYQEALRSLPFADAVRFEMDRSTGQAVRDMQSFDHRDGCFRDVAYEMLLADPAGEFAGPLLGELGFAGDALGVGLAVYREQHPRGPRQEQPALRAHIQNLDRAQWCYMYDASLLACFEREFPNAAPELGYPPSDPGLLIDDMPRREAYLARFLANRGDTAAALARLDAALRRREMSPLLLAARELIAREGPADSASSGQPEVPAGR
jgi:hypothetical protein